MTTLATSNAYSSRFLTPVLAVAIALALIAAHRERDVRCDIKSQVPRTYSTRRLRAVKDSTWEEKEVEDSRRRSRRDDSAGKEVGIEDESQVEKEMSPCPDERQSIGDNLPWSPLTTRGNHGGAYSSPGPTLGPLSKTGFLIPSLALRQ
ncbi:hypothetical protein PoB_005752000 [Plakobranchus ocellatus]|uniref:Uncharacterized protein n=1 Tax=Plakobranchus ocellatus TaxID=259542 RepID=A0AAV4CE08_9GAST|nr:hypothetical protein PoB_005752000 [Plakobranchus ocellatus]